MILTAAALLFALSEPAAAPSEQDSLIAAVRTEEDRRYHETCGRVHLPDRAFQMIDVTGDGRAELFAFFGVATCAATGAATGFAGTGGGIVQLWTTRQGRPALLLEDMMHGFTPTASGLDAFQHGSFCGNFPGATLCVSTYRWDEAAGRFELSGRRPYDDSHPGTEPAMRFDWSGAPAR